MLGKVLPALLLVEKALFDIRVLTMLTSVSYNYAMSKLFLSTWLLLLQLLCLNFNDELFYCGTSKDIKEGVL